MSAAAAIPLVYPVASPPEPTRFSLRSPRGANLATRVWPVKGPRALCLIVHGGGWHSGYFEGLAKVLNEADVFCGSYDQVSCGYSEEEPGTPSPGVTHVSSFDCFVEDLFEAVSWLRAEADDGDSSLPLFLIGESFGGLQVRPPPPPPPPLFPHMYF
jgi:alpha-beta hydrolase superfamily lysophospholipase